MYEFSYNKSKFSIGFIQSGAFRQMCVVWTSLILDSHGWQLHRFLQLRNLNYVLSKCSCIHSGDRYFKIRNFKFQPAHNSNQIDRISENACRQSNCFSWNFVHPMECQPIRMQQNYADCLWYRLGYGITDYDAHDSTCNRTENRNEIVVGEIHVSQIGDARWCTSRCVWILRHFRRIFLVVVPIYVIYGKHYCPVQNSRFVISSSMPMHDSRIYQKIHKTPTLYKHMRYRCALRECCGGDFRSFGIEIPHKLHFTQVPFHTSSILHRVRFLHLSFILIPCAETINNINSHNNYVYNARKTKSTVSALKISLWMNQCREI